MTDQNIQQIPTGWRETTLGKVADFSNGRSSPQRDDNFKFLVYGSNGIIGFANDINSPEKTIIIGRVGSYCGSLYFSNHQCWVTDNAIRANSKENSDPIYLYYLLITLRLNSRATGSGQPLINQEILKSIEVIVPPLLEQRAIASVLSAFDDKIELLREQNKTLEAIAQTLFNRWFVDFEFPNEQGKPYKSSGGKMIDSELGEIPEGWKVDRLGAYIVIRGGSTPSTDNPDFWNGDINWTSPKDLSNSNEVFLLKTEKRITEEGLKQISSNLLPKYTLLLSSRAPIGYLAITAIETAINQGYIAFLPNAYLSNYFMYLWLDRNMNVVEGSANGSTFLEISKSSFRDIESIIPKKETLKEFDSIIGSFFIKILANLYQIQILSQLRDTLLPKLMCGKVRVKGF